MASAALKKFYTPEEYLSLDRTADSKSEYLAGRIIAMAAASREHNVIAGNLASEVRTQLEGRTQRVVYAGDMRVRVRQAGLYTYPDVTVACGGPLFQDDKMDILCNPTLIVEVLAPTTELYDRGKKFGHYRRLSSLREYVLIAQDEVFVERFLRQGEDWLLTDARSMDDVLWLASIDCYVPLAEIYARIEFPDVSPAPNPGAASRTKITTSGRPIPDVAARRDRN